MYVPDSYGWYFLYLLANSGISFHRSLQRAISKSRNVCIAFGLLLGFIKSKERKKRKKMIPKVREREP